MNTDNLWVNGLWIGKALSAMELLTLKSFTAHGHRFRLWMYDKPDGELPQGVEWADAHTIIPRDTVFRYPDDSTIDWGAGSYGGFSDIFRYKLLYQQGGWWADMDVTCLKPFDFEAPYFFRNHWKLPVVGNIMKVPPKSALMEACYKDASEQVTPENTDWHKPITLLNEHIERLGLMKYRRLGLFNNDMAQEIAPYFQGDYPIPRDWYGIHWINSAGVKNFRSGSTFHQLLQRYKVPHQAPNGFFNKLLKR